MRLFVERFALTVLAAALIFVVTHQIYLSLPMRILFSGGIVIAALLASHFGEKKYADDNRDSRSPMYFLPLSLAVSLGTIGLVVYVLTVKGGENLAPQASSTTVEALRPGTRQDEQKKITTSRPTTLLLSSAPGRLPPKQSDVLTEYLRSPALARPSSAWSVLMFDGSGKEYSILRASAQSVLRESGSTTPSIFAKSLAPDGFADLFNADGSLMARLHPYCDGLVIGLVRSTTSPSDQVTGMYTTQISADVKQVSTSDGVRREFNVAENGTGFSVETSQSNAEERLAQRFKSEFVKSPPK